MHVLNTLIRFDWAMKSILRDKNNFDILEGFLTSLLGYDIIVENILESESNQDGEKLKFNRVDILVKDSQDDRFIIEIQNETESDYLERLLFGTCKTIVENLKLGDSYSSIKKVISISILYFNLGSGRDYLYHGKTEFRGVHTGELLEVRHRTEIKDEDNRTIRKMVTKKDMYPEYYLIEVERFEDTINEDIDEWIYFFKNGEIKDDFRSKNIQAAKKKLDILKMNVAQRKAYEHYLDSLASEKSVLESARDEGWDKGWVDGHAKGRKETAKKMKEKGYPIQDISDMTGLPPGEIKKL